MIANNIFKAIGDFFTNVLFVPYHNIRTMDNWWIQNSISAVFILIAFIAMLYWIGEIRKYKKAGNE
ncbi:DUF6341 family protein [Lutibacter citreus]|uniref:DUF6341 family protein n=1 Tax=Lutibacter citreus TaxID=2138210 RepID=UPI000DBE8470|nr:hypothetical protein [Lutibacter citreus]